MLDFKNAMKSERLMKAVTGMSSSEFFGILPIFSKLVEEKSFESKRIRQPGGGAAHTLYDAASKLFYILFYLKCYPTYDLAAFFYGVDRSQTCRWSHAFMPLLEKTLGGKQFYQGGR